MVLINTVEIPISYSVPLYSSLWVKAKLVQKSPVPLQ